MTIGLDWRVEIIGWAQCADVRSVSTVLVEELCGGGDQCYDMEGHHCQSKVTCHRVLIGRILCWSSYLKFSLAVNKMEYIAFFSYSISTHLFWRCLTSEGVRLCTCLV